MTHGNRRTLIWTGLALCASLILHAVFLLLPGFRTPRTEPPRSLEVALLQPPALPSREESEPEPKPDPTSTPDSDSLQPPKTQESPEESAARPLLTQPELTPAIPEPDPPTLTGRQVLQAVRKPALPAAPERSSALEPARIPSLPDAPGWLNDYTGTVTPSIDRWVENDGSRRTRMVLHNGQVICGRADPPTSSEISNPQLATNIMRFTHCGRERPEPVDRTDPRVRAPASP